MAWRFFLRIIRFKKNVVRKQRKSKFKPQEIIMKLSFKEGDWVDFDTWTTEFSVSGQRGINYSKKYNVVVCVSKENGEENPYEDKWYTHETWDGVRFTGEGKNGDQKLTSVGNNRLNDKKRAHFFRKKNGESRYLYCGLFELVEEPNTLNPRSEEQYGVDGKKRHVWMFNMKYIHNRYPEKLAQAMKNF